MTERKPREISFTSWIDQQIADGQAAVANADSALQAAAPNKGGHRERAMRLIEHAMGEVQAGIDFAYRHGGGGY